MSTLPAARPSPELIARLWALEIEVLALGGRITAQVSPWYAQIAEDAARLLLIADS